MFIVQLFTIINSSCSGMSARGAIVLDNTHNMVSELFCLPNLVVLVTSLT